MTKIHRIVRAAQHYLMRYERLPPCRIDVVTIDGAEVEWLQNAIQGPA